MAVQPRPRESGSSIETSSMERWRLERLRDRLTLSPWASLHYWDSPGAQVGLAIFDSPPCLGGTDLAGRGAWEAGCKQLHSRAGRLPQSSRGRRVRLGCCEAA